MQDTNKLESGLA